jgi:hypothetical protein
MTNYEQIKDLDEYGTTKFLVLFQTAQIIPLDCSCKAKNCTFCTKDYICFKKWLDSESEQITLYNAIIESRKNNE